MDINNTVLRQPLSDEPTLQQESPVPPKNPTLPSPETTSSNVSQSTDVDLRVTASSNPTDDKRTSLTVNGEEIDVPENGAQSTTVKSGGTTTNVSIYSSNSSSGDTDSRQRLKITSQSSSKSSISIKQDETVRKDE